jgi:hypothetical protein
MNNVINFFVDNPNDGILSETQQKTPVITNDFQRSIFMQSYGLAFINWLLTGVVKL